MTAIQQSKLELFLKEVEDMLSNSSLTGDGVIATTVSNASLPFINYKMRGKPIDLDTIKMISRNMLAVYLASQTEPKSEGK